MLAHQLKSALIIYSAFLVSACSGLSPTHLGRFTFEGVVKDEAGKPVPSAWVKVRGWETLTDNQGRWRQVQVVNCGSLREHMSDFEENDQVLVMADGYHAAEEDFIVKHPGWFQSCKAEQTLVFETTLKPKPRQSDATPSLKTIPRKESPAMPWPDETDREKGKKGTVTL